MINQEQQLELKHIFESNIEFDRNIDRKIIFYGAGKLGVMAYDVLAQIGEKPSYAVDKSRSGLMLNDIVIKSLDELTETDKKEALFLVCISTISYNEICQSLYEQGIEHIMQFYTYAFLKCPDILGNGWLVEKNSENMNKASAVISLLEDDCSKWHYLQFLWWKIFNTEKVFSNYPIHSGTKYYKEKIISSVLTQNETLLDVGSYKGATIDKFIEAVDHRYKKICAVEPDRESYEFLSQRYLDDKIELRRIALGDRAKWIGFREGMGYASQICEAANHTIYQDTIDNLCLEPSIIKIHAEGAELSILKGGIKTITDNKPIIMVLGDHNIDGFYNIPMFVNELEDYKLYFRLHDYCGNSAVYYYVPVDR